jgi:hypothetical protein
MPSTHPEYFQTTTAIIDGNSSGMLSQTIYKTNNKPESENNLINNLPMWLAIFGVNG